MVIKWPHWQIISYEYGYKVQRKISKERWVTHTYHNNLRSAVLELLNYRLQMDTTDMVVNASDTAAARLGTARLVKKIETIADEILQAVNSEEKDV
jgi:hypothetical protein